MAAFARLSEEVAALRQTGPMSAPLQARVAEVLVVSAAQSLTAQGGLFEQVSGPNGAELKILPGANSPLNMRAAELAKNGAVMVYAPGQLLGTPFGAQWNPTAMSLIVSDGDVADASRPTADLLHGWTHFEAHSIREGWAPLAVLRLCLVAR